MPPGLLCKMCMSGEYRLELMAFLQAEDKTSSEPLYIGVLDQQSRLLNDFVR